MSGYSLFRVSARAEGGGLKPAERLGSSDPVKRHLMTVFVHGFNNDEFKALKNWDDKVWPHIEKLMNRQRSDAMLFFWPSDSNILKSIFKPAAVVLYSSRVETAISAGVELAKYFRRIAKSNPDLRLQFVGYSLGCRVVLSAAEQLSEEPQEVPVVRVLLMGAAVPDGDCEEPGPWPDKLRDLFGGVYGRKIPRISDVVLHSPDDDILKGKFEFGEKWAREHKGLQSRGGKAVGLTGGPSRIPGDPNRDRWTRVVPCELTHAAYLTDDAALWHVAAMFGTVRDRLLAEHRGGTRLLDEQQPDQRLLASVSRFG